MITDYYELRYIETNAVESTSFSLFDDFDDRVTLVDILEKKDKILLLGNPGVGKSTELKTVFDILWQKVDKNQEVPIFLNIKNFRLTTVIEDLLPDNNWKEFPSIIFIFDGLDEIAAIQNFISELELFLFKYQKLKIKCIISCRTNIYEKYLIDIPGFETVYLKYLSDFQIKNILTKKYDLDISFEEIKSKESILQTPFNLDLFANYYIQNQSFPKTVQESWQLFIAKEIHITREKLVKRSVITEAKIIDSCKRVAVTNELMQQNSISEEHLYKLLGDNGIDIFQELPFVEKEQNQNNFIFRHKNFQEYFAAKYIADLNIEKIIDFIKAENLEKVKPSLFNTVTFLLNLLSDKKFEVMKDWLFANDLEILFFADGNRLDQNFKNEIFKNYYEEQCLSKTFWLTNNGKVKIDVLADYADFEYIIEEIKNKERLERNRLSLVEVLSYKFISKNENEIVKTLFKELLKEESSFFQSEILRAIKTMAIHKNEMPYWNQVLEIIKNSLARDVSHQLISILGNLDDETRNNKTLLEIIKRHFRLERDNVIRGTEQVVGNLILNTQDSELLLELFKILFDNNYSIKIDDIYSNDFPERFLDLVKKQCIDSDFKEELIKFCFIDESRLITNDFLSNLLFEIKLSPQNILDILKVKRYYNNSLYTICKFFTKESIDAIVNEYSESKLIFENVDDVKSIRNWMSHNDLNLALYWQSKFIAEGYVFPELLFTHDEREKAKEKYESFKISNFSLLFDKELLKFEIQNYFAINELRKIEQVKFRKLFWKWYEDTGYHGLTYTVHTVIERAFRRYPNLTVDNVFELLEDEYFYLLIIKSVLSHNSAYSFNLSSQQTIFLTNLLDKLEKKINYSNVIKFDSQFADRFTTTENYEFIKLILFFDIKYDTRREKDFYIKVLQFGNVAENHRNENSNFINFIKFRFEEIGENVSELNKQVVYNINNSTLIYFAKIDHIIYAIEKDLKECFERIGEDLMQDNYFFDQEDILKNYLTKIQNPLTYLKKCCIDLKTHLCWKAITLIKEKYKDDNFILKVARDYLNSQETNYIHKAVNILFYMNQSDALYYYSIMLGKMLDMQYDSSGDVPKDVSNYNQLNEIHLIEPLFYTIFNEAMTNTFYLHLSREFLRVLIANLGRSDTGYEKLISILTKIKNKVDIKSSQAYYVNHLIEILENSHIKEKSQKINFEDVLDLIL